ncbi:MAG: glycosyltransferase family 39 protein, partial [Chloroflexi bacterium]|nr:glycosyltransferase family 39 protein [Chloroflexota bacterium]
MKKVFSNKKDIILNAIIGGLLFFSAGHHLLNFWEQSFLKMLLLFIFLVPLFTIGLSLFTKWITPLLKESDKKRLYLLAGSALIIGILFSLEFYRSPKAYHILEITPILENTEGIEIVEVKADKSVLEISEKEISAAGWQRGEDEIIQAVENSQPLKISFRSKANTPVSILLSAFPEGGKIEASLSGTKKETDTNRQQRGQTQITLVSTYRGIPNWIFIPILALSDLLLFSAIVLSLLLIQERGMAVAASRQPAPANHRRNLFILLGVGSIIHLFNILTVPLILDVDTPSYLQGAIHFIEHGNLEGTSAVRGIGSTFLFTPIIFLFGRNPWGMKIFLHLFAIACIPLAYKIAWQLTKSERAAFLSGFFAMLSPDLMLYSNYLWSDLINLFAALLYLTALFSALKKPTFSRIFALMLINSMAILFRTESIVLLPIGAFFLFWKAFSLFDLKAWKKKKVIKEQSKTITILWQTSLSLLLAIIPIILSAAHNNKIHGFFGLNSYAGESFYDGWVYYGDASNLNFSNQESEAIQIINDSVEKHPIIITDKKNVATGWEIYPSLLKSGYTSEEAMDIFAQATFDSITNDWGLTFKFLRLKMRKGLSPSITHLKALPLPEERPDAGTVKENFYDLESFGIPYLVNIQRKINEALPVFYLQIYPYIVWLIVPTIFFALFRKPSILWVAFFVITLTRTFMPIIMG